MKALAQVAVHRRLNEELWNPLVSHLRLFSCKIFDLFQKKILIDLARQKSTFIDLLLSVLELLLCGGVML